MSHAARLKKACDAYENGVARLRQARDAAIIAAHEDGEPYQTIAVACGMSMDNVRRIVKGDRRVKRSR